MFKKIIASLLKKKAKKLTHLVDIGGREIMLYGCHHEQYWNKLELVGIDDLNYSFRFVYKNKIKEGCSFQLAGVAKNIDPEGLCKLDIYDPEGGFNPTEVYIFENESFSFWICIPLIISPVIGIKVEFKDENPCKIKKHEAVLSYYEKD